MEDLRAPVLPVPVLRVPVLRVAVLRVVERPARVPVVRPRLAEDVLRAPVVRRLLELLEPLARVRCVRRRDVLAELRVPDELRRLLDRVCAMITVSLLSGT